MVKTSPAKFVREVRQELAKVTWPSRRELTFTTISVFAMSALAALFFFVVDQLIAFGVQLILGFGG
ncbi:MAG: preprotein translocase subunit SecE [Geminicoccaceae bacterium]|nr:preprotein translocase subunit SecE [Geminicoccaceae bacterium]